MLQIAHVLCPVDLSDASLHALDRAVAMASWYGARVTALHVYAKWPVVDVIPALRTRGMEPISLDPEARQGLLDELQRFTERRAQRDVPVELRFREAANVPVEIVSEASALDADMLVVGSHGRSGFTHLVLGSVTEKLVRTSPCPVLIVPPQDQGAPGLSAKPARIVCPVDFSEASKAALRRALAMAEEADAHLTVLHAIEVPPELQEAHRTAAVDVKAARLAAEAAALRELRALIPADAATFCTVETAVAEGKASTEILRQAKSEIADLIVMGAEGRSAVELWLFGSNTQQVVRAATCPVLVVRR